MSIDPTAPLQSLKRGWQTFSENVCNQLKESYQIFLQKHKGSDLFIITGAGGAGKSSFIKSITGEDIYIGSSLESGTTTTTLVPAVIHGKRCLFLDMPGFNTSDSDDWDIFFKLMAAMAVVHPYVNFRGVLYVDSIDSIRRTRAAEKILTWLSLFCGTEYMPNVTVVTTKWDGLDADGIADKFDRYKAWSKGEFGRRFFEHKAKIFHYGLVEEDRTLHINRDAGRRRSLARDMIRTHYQNPSNLTLQIYAEIADGASVKTTSAGRWLKEGSNPTAEDAFVHEEQQEEPDGSQSDDDERTSEAAQDDQSSGFWSDFRYRDVVPWIKLLVKAATIFASPSPGFSAFDDAEYPDMFENEFDFADSFFPGPEEFIPTPEPSLGSTCVIF